MRRGRGVKLDKNIKHNIEIVVDRLIVREGIEKRLTDSIETAMNLGGGLMMVDVDGREMLNFSQNFACPDCGISIDEVEPRSFSFNNPFGACPDCFGLGYKMEFDEDLSGSPARIRGALPERFWMPWRRNTSSVWIRLLKSIPRRSRTF